MKYYVSIPITGIIVHEVEADNEDEAIDKAWQEDVSTDSITEWDMHNSIVTGNVFHGMQNSIDVEEV